jgi:trans-aconitate methyltransferase
MAVGPADRVLEIGCGQGLAVSMVAQRLRTGRVTALDRSQPAVNAARRRNAVAIDAGRADIRCVELAAVQFPEHSFDKVFAVNVSLFWLGDASAVIDRVTPLLTVDGRLYVFSERPSARIGDAIGARTVAALRRHGLRTTVRTASTRQGTRLTAVIASRSDPAGGSRGPGCGR